MTNLIQNEQEFLNNVSEALGRPIPTQPPVKNYKYSPQHEMYQGLTQDDLAIMLEEQCQVIHTKFKKTTSEQLVATLADTFKEYKTTSVFTWNNQELLDLAHKAADPTVTIKGWSDNFEENIAFGTNATVGLTFCDYCMAESGTLTILADSQRGRSVAYLPEKHVAIIKKSQLVPRFTQVANKITEMQRQTGTTPSCIDFISGPSNSADIEMNLLVGVHGPIASTYILIEDQ